MMDLLDPDPLVRGTDPDLGGPKNYGSGTLMRGQEFAPP
jgi:hypothetical protein